VSAGLTLSRLRAEHPMLTLIELIYVKKKHEKLTVACKGDALPALLVWFHHNLAGFSNSNNDFCYYYYFINITTIITQLTVNGKKIMKVPNNQFRARKSPERQLHYTAVQ
jgi:hypothetical protein